MAICHGCFQSLRLLNLKALAVGEPSSWPTSSIFDPGRDRNPFRSFSDRGQRQQLLLHPGQIASIPLCSSCPDIRCTSESKNALSCSSLLPHFNRLLKKSFFAGCSKMPRCKAPEILRVASRRIRSDSLPRRRVGEPAMRRTWMYAATTKDEGCRCDE